MPPDLTETELAILEALWDLGPSTIRQLTDRLYPGGTAAHYATVQKLLERMEEGKKRCVVRDRSAVPHVFTAAVSREAFVGGQLRAIAERLCGGSLTPVLTHLVKTRGLSADERKALRKLLDQ